MSDIQHIKQRLRALTAEAAAGFEVNHDSSTTAQIISLAEQLESLSPTARPVDDLRGLDGRWKMLYSSFGLERNTTLRRISFATLPRDAEIAVTGVFQMVDSASGCYDNHVEFVTKSAMSGVHVTRGVFKPEDGSDKRLAITFIGNHARPLSSEKSVDDLRLALGIEPDAPLEAPVNFTGWSDVTYLDDEFRLMRGNAGNLYVLEKVAAA